MGREMDVRILLEVMGGSVKGNPRGNQDLYCPKGFRIGTRRGCNSEWNLIGYQKTDLPYYSTDIAAAFQVVEKLAEIEYVKINLSISHYHGCHCQITAPHESQQRIPMQDAGEFAESMPEAICKAALKALSAIERKDENGD